MTDFADNARALIRRGYHVIPITPGEKTPAYKNWQNRPLKPEQAPRYPGHNVGILTGYGDVPLAAVDLDIYDAATAERLTGWCEALGAPLVRVGQAPKVLVLFRTVEPWRKITSAAYQFGEQRNRIEVLGTGQQFVACGIHPDTALPYQWLDLFGGPTELDAASLPVLTTAHVADLFGEFDKIAAERGWPQAKKAAKQATSAPVDPDQALFDNARTYATLEEAAQWAGAVDCNDYDAWLNLGMALHHEFAATDDASNALALWDEVSRRFPNYKDFADLQLRWDSFAGDKPRQVTLRSVAAAYHKAAPETKAAAAVAADVPVPGKRAKFTPIPASEFATGPAMKWWIKGVLPQAEIAVIFGESGSGKSFLGLDMAFAVALGLEWRGLKVTQANAVVLAAEGASGIRQRLRAWSEHSGHFLDGIPLYVIPDTPNLLDTDPRIIAQRIQALGGAGVVFVDTLAAATLGANENSGEDMGKAISGCKLLHRLTGALVVLIHHSGKDTTKGARGWSGLRAAVDAEIEVTRDGDSRKAVVTKMKDGQDGQAWGFKLAVVTLGEDEDGDPVTSCAVEEAPLEVGGAAGGRQRMGPIETIVMRVVDEMCGVGATEIDYEVVVKDVAGRLGGGPDPRGNRRQRASRAVDSLQAKGYLSVHSGVISRPLENAE